MNKLSQEIDLILEDFNNDKKDEGKFQYTHERITLVLPNDYKKRYDEIQELSGKKFSKVISKIVKKAIDSVK